MQDNSLIQQFHSVPATNDDFIQGVSKNPDEHLVDIKVLGGLVALLGEFVDSLVDKVDILAVEYHLDDSVIKFG